jgi:hypothetical protein
MTATAGASIATTTAIAEARAGTATEIASYVSVDWRDFTTYPDNYAGKSIKIEGTVFNIIDNETFQMWVGSSQPVVVLCAPGLSGLYAGSIVTVYGVGAANEWCGTNAYGGTICQPQILADFYVKG